ncbi:MAG: class I SAM-dependent rRNA methyltransferase [Gammaproteobacteria bacterium]
MTDLSFAPLRLKKGQERRIRQGHVWVYGSEVDRAQTPLEALSPGQAIELQMHNGRVLGTGYANPKSLICARLVSRDPKHPFSPSLLVHRLKVALSLRERLYAQPYYRWVHGESDGLPGVIIDRFGPVVVIQIGTAGMESMREALIAAVDKVVSPETIVLRNDGKGREREGLSSYVEVVHGQLDDIIWVQEQGLRFGVSLSQGQKTGWFYDQRDNRARAARYAEGLRVLDVFPYVGGFGLTAASHDAAHVTFVDASEHALERVADNAEANNLETPIEFLQGDAFEVLKALREDRQHFDLVMVDPPAFIPRRKDQSAGEAAYRRINQAAMQLLSRDGYLVTSSCSSHLERAKFQTMLGQSARHLDRDIQILEHGYQAPDHPIHPSIPETDYLKMIVARITHH